MYNVRKEVGKKKNNLGADRVRSDRSRSSPPGTEWKPRGKRARRDEMDAGEREREREASSIVSEGGVTRGGGERRRKREK